MSEEEEAKRTILDRAGLWAYHGAQGRSLLPLLAGESDWMSYAAAKSDMLFQLVQEMADLADISRLPVRLA